MKTSALVAGIAAAVIVVGGAAYFVDVDQTQEAQLPNVDVSVEGGQAPKFDVETGSVDVSSEEKTIVVPEVELVEKEVTVPTLEVTPAGE